MTNQQNRFTTSHGRCAHCVHWLCLFFDQAISAVREIWLCVQLNRLLCSVSDRVLFLIGMQIVTVRGSNNDCACVLSLSARILMCCVM